MAARLAGRPDDLHSVTMQTSMALNAGGGGPPTILGAYGCVEYGRTRPFGTKKIGFRTSIQRNHRPRLDPSPNDFIDVGNGFRLGLLQSDEWRVESTAGRR
jgi:hypothetical protein